MEILEALKTIAQYGGLPGLFVVYLILSRQRSQDKNDSDGKESAMDVKVKALDEEMRQIKADRKAEADKIDDRFKILESKVDSNHKELNNKLDKMNENQTAVLMSIKDILGDIKTDVAVLNDRKMREDKK